MVGDENKIRKLARKQIIYTRHAVDRMNLEGRLITTEEVREVIFSGRIVEDREDDPRGENYLFSGVTSAGRTVHVSLSPKENYLVIVTAYIPDPKEWSEDFTKRKKKI